MSKQRIKWIFTGLAAGLLLGGAALLIWHYYPLIQSLMQPENMDLFRQRLHSFGLLGIIILLGVQILQVFSGIIPALPIQLAAGVTYGAIRGTAICIGGILIGSAIVFITVKRFGQPVLDRMFPKEKQEKLVFLHDADRLSMIVFIIYLIPAMPKDVLTYLAALTPLTLTRFLSITLIARIPTILGNTFASSALLQGNTTASVIVFCITTTLGLTCMLFSKKILTLLHRLK